MDGKKIAKKAYYQARKENIKDFVTCANILEHYGVDLLYTEAEVQYRCPLHGDGIDKKKSARYYPETDSTYCWGCHQYRDHFGLVMDFEDCSFPKSLSIIEKKWEIDDVPDIYEFTNSSEEKKQKFQSNLENELDEIFQEENSIMDQFYSLERKIDRFIDEYREKIEMETALKIYHAYDHLLFRIKEGIINKEDAIQIKEKLSSKVNQLVQEITLKDE